MPSIAGMGSTAVGSSGSAALPVGTRAGDLAIWHMAYGEQGAVGGPPVVPGWTLLHYDVATGSNSYGAGIALFYRFLDGSEHGLQVANWHGEVDLARITVFRGVSSEDPFEGASLASGASGARSLPSLTTTGPNRLGACFGSQVQGPSNSFSGETGGDWESTYEVGDGGATDMRFGGHVAQLPAATTVSGATSTSTSYPWLQRCLALVPGEAEPAADPAPQLRLAGSPSVGSNGSAVMPIGVRKGELALWYMGYNQNNTGAIASPPTVSGWTLLHFDQTTGTSHRVALAIYYRILTGSESGATQTANWNGNVDLAWIDVYAGVDESAPFGNEALSAGASGTRTMPSLTVADPDRTLVAYSVATTPTASNITGTTGGVWQFGRRASETGGSDSAGELWLAAMAEAGTISGGSSAGVGYPWLIRAFELNPSYQPFVSAADFTEPDEVTPVALGAQTATELTVAWTEEDPPPGLSITSRSLQRQAATAASYDGCLTAAFANDGSAVTGESPVLVEGLVAGKCYRWVLTLTFSDASNAVATSGTRFISQYGLRLTNVPTAAVGSTVAVAAVVVDAGGEPVDGLTSTLTINASDPLAAFPAGNTHILDDPDDLTGHTFEVRFGTPGEQWIEVHAPGLAVGSSVITVGDVALEATAPQTVYAGIPFMLEVAPQRDGVDDPRYTGVVEFTSSDTTATYSRTSGTPPTFTFACNCTGHETFAARLSTLGQQTITVTDEAGTTDTVTVEVVAAPSAIPSPVASLDYVKWDRGNVVDWYLTAVEGAAPFTVIEATNSCNQPAGAVGVRVVPNTDRFVEFSSEVPKQICDDDYLSDISHTLIVIDDAGHTWTLIGSGHSRFSTVPNNSNFTMLDAGDPIADWAVVERPGGGGPIDVGSHRIFRGGMRISFYAYEPTRLLQVFIGRPGILPYMSAGASAYIPAGESTVATGDITYACYVGNSEQPTQSGWLKYGSASGRSGAIANGGGFLPGPGAPTGDCSDPSTGDDEMFGLFDFLAAINPANWPIIGDVGRFMAADPIDPLNGSFTQSVNDFSLGGLTPALDLTRTYRSDRAEKSAIGDTNATGIFGPGWGSSVDQRLVILDGGDTVHWYAFDGGVLPFTRLEDGSYGTPIAGVGLTAVSGGFELEMSGSSLIFDSAGVLTAMQDRQGRQLTFAYDTGGNLESMTDAAGRTADFSIDANGRVTRVDLPDGRYVAFTYTSDGFLATARSLSGSVLTYVTDNRGRITEIRNAADEVLLTNTYDDRGRVVSQTDAVGNTSYLTYDEGARMTQLADPLGAITTDCFLESGKLSHRIDALGHTSRWVYDNNGPTSITNALGEVTRFSFNSDGLPTSVTDSLGRTQTISYDADGLVTQVTDQVGNTVTPTYDASGRPVSVVRAEDPGLPMPNTLELASYTYNAMGLPATISEPGGADTSLSYTSLGYLAGISDAEGRQTTYTVDARGFVTAVVDPLGTAAGGTPSEHTSAYTYDDAGRMLTATDAEDDTTAFEYDAMGRLLRTTSPLGSVTTYTYDGDGRLLSTTTDLNDTDTATTSFAYDAGGNLIRVTDAEGRQTEFEYDAMGRRVLMRDPAGGVWLTVYDALGRVVETTDPTGRNARTEYDSAGRVSKTIDAAGAETTYAYDDFDQLVSVTDPLGRVTTFAHDWLGRQTQLTDAEGEITVSAFDDAGDLVAITDAEGNATAFTYDATHRLQTVVDAALGETGFAYDAAGRLIQRTNARGKSETFAYDDVGRQTLTTDALGNQWQTTYDADGRIDFTIDGMGQTTEFSFDRAGRLLSVDPAGSMQAIAYTYDDTGRQLTMTDANGVSTFTYDAVGNLTSHDRGGHTVSYAYDAAGRPTSVGYPDSTGSVSYSYDSAGRLHAITDWAGRTTTVTYDAASRVTSLARPNDLTTSFVYDDVDRLLGIDHLQGGSPLLELDYTYDAVGNVLSYTDDSGTATFGYNQLNQLTSADYPGANDFTYAYDAVGNLTQLSGPNATLTRAFNVGDQLLTETISGSLLETAAATGATGSWTDMGNVSASDDADASAAPAAGSTLTMNADGFDFSSVPADAVVTDVTVKVEWACDLSTAELTLGAQARVDGILVGSEVTETGNPTTDTVESFAVAGLDRAGIELLTVDLRATRAAGDPVTASVDAVTIEVTYTLPPRSFTYDANGSLIDNGAGRTFTYDALGRLTAVAGAVDATYAYDGAGRRISATVDGVTTDLVLDVRGMGSVLADGSNRFLPGGPNAGHESGGAWLNALANRQGSVLGYADASGLVGTLTHYDPYGGPLPGSAPPATGPGFTGEWTDATGLVNLRFRAYDPSLQAFFGRDTFAGVASAPLTANRYAYALGNPLRYTDPSGHFVNEFLRHPGLWSSVFVQSLPFAGDFYSGLTGLWGFDPIAGITLSPADRALAIGSAFMVGGGLHLVGHLADGPGDEIAEAAGRAVSRTGSRSVDEIGELRGAGHSGNGLSGSGRAADLSPHPGPSGLRVSPESEPDAAFHHTFERRLESIREEGLRPGTFATPVPGLSPIQAQIELAMPPNRGLPDVVIEIDLAGLRAAGYEIPAIARVPNVVRGQYGRIYSQPGGGFEMQFPYPIPSEFVTVRS